MYIQVYKLYCIYRVHPRDTIPTGVFPTELSFLYQYETYTADRGILVLLSQILGHLEALQSEKTNTKITQLLDLSTTERRNIMEFIVCDGKLQFNIARAEKQILEIKLFLTIEKKINFLRYFLYFNRVVAPLASAWCFETYNYKS